MDFPVDIITGVLLADGWYQVAVASFALDSDPALLLADGSRQTPVGGTWARFTDAATGATVACSLDRVLALRADPPPQPPP